MKNEIKINDFKTKGFIPKVDLTVGVFEERLDSMGTIRPFFKSLPNELPLPKCGIKVHYCGEETITATQLIEKSGGIPFKNVAEAYGLAGSMLKNKIFGIIAFYAPGGNDIVLIRASGRTVVPEPQVYVEELITVDNPQGIRFTESTFYFSGPLINEPKVVFQKVISKVVDDLT